MRVALVVMPFAAATRPSLAAGLLQAAVQRRGISCDTKYFNVTLARMMGPAAYGFFVNESSVTVLSGEWAFSQAMFGEAISSWDRYSREVLDAPHWGMPAQGSSQILALRALAPAFLQVALESNDWGAYDLVGFTSTFEQVMPSLALARLIRERYPRVKIALGGASFEAGMGRPYIEYFDFVDYVSSGEADVSFPALCERLRDGDPEVPPGFYYRAGDRVLEAPRTRATSIASLDLLPTPEYTDFFRVARATFGDGALQTWVPVEASRGCWWGERSHCTFCGLNGESMAFRAKSSGRVLQETDELAARHGPLALQFTDNILGLTHLAEVIPAWAARRDGRYKFFEIKSNIKREQLRQMRAAGVTSVQAGVESLSDRTLRIMGKGVSGAQNVAALRWCAELGMEAMWNVLFGFPGEDLDEMPRMAELFGKMVHLHPPSACAPIRMDRFSPNYERAASLGFSAAEPMPAYRHVFPLPEAALAQLAYYFRYEHPAFEAAVEKSAVLVAAQRAWADLHREGRQGELRVRSHGEGRYELLDTRAGIGSGSRWLSREEAAAVFVCDAPVSRSRAAAQAAAASRAPREAAADALAAMERSAVIVEIGSRMVTLAMLPADREEQRSTKVSLSVFGG